MPWGDFFRWQRAGRPRGPGTWRRPLARRRWGGPALPVEGGVWRVMANGVAATLLFRLILQSAAWAGAPPLDPGLWLGTFVTAYLPAAGVVGTGLMLGTGIAVAALYRLLRPRLPPSPLAAGAWFGAGLWLVMGLVGFPVFAWLSPMVNNGLLLDPGAFGLGFGTLDAFILLVAYLALGLALALGQALGDTFGGV